MFVLGALGLFCGVFMLFAGAVLTPAQVAASPQAAQIQQMESQIGMSIQKIAQVVGAMMGIPALLFLILGYFVYRGSKVGIILSLILTGITLLFLAVNLVTGAIGGAANAAMGMCMLSVPIILSGLLLAWLIQALRASSAVAAMQQQYHAQYAYHQQQLQAYQQQGGYGYGQQQQPYGQQPSPPPQQNYGQQPGYRQSSSGATPGIPQYGVPPQSPPTSPEPQQQQPPDSDSVRHPPLPPSPNDPEGPFGNPPQG
ncbi:MAG: hypothetical protein JWL69_3806 [Phycisphaerales bacterium]|nr:hypothetical protein [Phycisphaerales bacterium]